MQLTKSLRRHARLTAVASLVALALVASMASAATNGASKPKPKHGVKAATFTKGARGAKGATGATGATGAQGAKGDTGAQGAQGSAGPKGDTGAQGAKGEKGDKGDKGDPSAPAPTMQRLSGGFAGTNATVATSLDGVQFGPYPDGGSWGGSVLYKGADGRKLSEITQLSYTINHSSGDDSPIAAPYLRIFTTDGETAHDVIYDPTKCATFVPKEDTFNTYDVTTGDVRYDDDPCSSGASQQPYAAVVAAHGTDTITGIYITTGFAGGKPLAAILRSFSVNGSATTFGAP